MAFTYGFYNSLNGDRKYNTEQMSRIFDGIINDGIFASIGTSMVVQASEGMNLLVGTGKAWFKHTWAENDTVYPLTVSQSEIILDRIDTVVLEVNHNEDVRSSYIKVIKGTPDMDPVVPTLVNSEFIGQLPLCNIRVNSGITEITQGNIENLVGTPACPFITGLISTVTIEGITSILNYEWSVWFATIQDQLDGDTAGNLLNMIQKSSYLSDAEPVSPMSHTVWYDIQNS